MQLVQHDAGSYGEAQDNDGSDDANSVQGWGTFLDE
jgi:hypothetical protein